VSVTRPVKITTFTKSAPKPITIGKGAGAGLAHMFNKVFGSATAMAASDAASASASGGASSIPHPVTAVETTADQQSGADAAGAEDDTVVIGPDTVIVGPGGEAIDITALQVGDELPAGSTIQTATGEVLGGRRRLLIVPPPLLPPPLLPPPLPVLGLAAHAVMGKGKGKGTTLVPQETTEYVQVT